MCQSLFIQSSASTGIVLDETSQPEEGKWTEKENPETEVPENLEFDINNPET